MPLKQSSVAVFLFLLLFISECPKESQTVVVIIVMVTTYQVPPKQCITPTMAQWDLVCCYFHFIDEKLGPQFLGPKARRPRTWAISASKLVLLLLLRRFSRVRLCATPKMAAHQAPPSLGFSRQEHWSGLPFPSPMHESEKWKGSRSVLSDSSRPHGLQPTRLLHPWDFPGKSTGVGCGRSKSLLFLVNSKLLCTLLLRLKEKHGCYCKKWFVIFL